MPAPNQPTRRPRVGPFQPGPLRLRMADSPGSNRLDGVWWPRSRDLAAELTDLVDHFPVERLGRIVRVQVSAPDWDAQPRHVLVRGGYVKVGPLPPADLHVVHLTTSDRTLLHVLVIPPSFTREQGQEALQAAMTRGNTCSTSDLLREVRDGRLTPPAPRAGSHPGTGRVTRWVADAPASSSSGRRA